MRNFLAMIGLVLFSAASFGQQATSDALQARIPLPKEANLVRPDFPHLLVVKFRDDLKARTDNARLKSVAGANLDAVSAVTKRYGARFEPLIDLPQEKLDFLEQRAAQHSGKAQPDLGGMFHVAAAEDGNLLECARALKDLVETEFVYFEHLQPPPPCTDISPTTSSYTAQQGYAGPNPGVNMLAAWLLGNARASGVRIADCEFAYNTGHEDLCNITSENGQTPNTSRLSDYEHGTAVFGEMIGLFNTYGVNGLVPDAQGLFFTEQSSQGGSRRVAAITAAIAAVGTGHIVVLEMQTGSPLAPAETEQAVWTVVRNGTDAGVVVVAAAGNGTADLDSAAYATYRGWGDSGAIIVGAGSSNTNHDALNFSTFGSRVSVQGWGQNVVTLGYGDLAALGSGVNQQYTSIFNGTSSATPIVAACCAALQGLATERWGYWLSPRNMRDLLIETGVGQGSGGHIGPLPDVVAAAAELEPSVWVDLANPGGAENGSYERPYNTIDEGIAATQPNGLMHIWAVAVPTPRNFTAPMRIKAWGGTVTIGAP